MSAYTSLCYWHGASCPSATTCLKTTSRYLFEGDKENAALKAQVRRLQTESSSTSQSPRETGAIAGTQYKTSALFTPFAAVAVNRPPGPDPGVEHRSRLTREREREMTQTLNGRPTEPLDRGCHITQLATTRNKREDLKQKLKVLKMAVEDLGVQITAMEHNLGPLTTAEEIEAMTSEITAKKTDRKVLKLQISREKMEIEDLDDQILNLEYELGPLTTEEEMLYWQEKKG